MEDEVVNNARGWRRLKSEEERGGEALVLSEAELANRREEYAD